MSGFDKDWLALREPADRKARAGNLIDRLCLYMVATKPHRALLDIGCGTGSTFRTLSPLVPVDTDWHLLDYDPLLLEEAKLRTGERSNIRFRRHDLNDLDSLPLDGVTVVTASALFDLCSADFCNRFIDAISPHGAGLYAALNYDGVMQWTKPHPLDEQVVADFNRHQHFDKGFGPALGPDATQHLRLGLEWNGYHVCTAPSPWVLGPDQARLQAELLHGIVRPLTEVGNLSSAEISDWLAFRRASLPAPDSSCVVGHTDLIALRKR
jgi:SAM-dependent methyltransferase